MATGWIREVGRNFELSILGRRLGDLYDIRQALPPGYEDPYIEHMDLVQNPDLENEAEEEYINEDEDDDDENVGQVEEDEEEEAGEGNEVEEEEEEEPLAHSRRKYSPLSTRSGKMRI